MKNFKTLFLLLIVAMVGISLQSCGGDDDDSIYIQTHILCKLNLLKRVP